MNCWRDLAIDLEGLDWKRFLSEWEWLLAQRRFEAVAMSSFGDWFLVDAAGAIHFLDIVGGELRKVADSMTEFEVLASLPAHLNEWFLAELVLLLRERGMSLKKGECYGFKLPPGVGGKIEPENIEPTAHMVHQSIQAQTLDYGRKLPPGTRITGFRVM